jgi:hypothetical protein
LEVMVGSMKLESCKPKCCSLDYNLDGTRKSAILGECLVDINGFIVLLCAEFRLDVVDLAVLKEPWR